MKTFKKQEFFINILINVSLIIYYEQKKETEKVAETK